MSSTNKAYESFNVDIINNKDPQVQLHKSKELTKDFLTSELNKNYGMKINILSKSSNRPLSFYQFSSTP